MGAGPAWMRRGTQGHVAAPRGPASRLRGAIYLFIYIYIYIVSINGSSAFPIGKGYYPLKPSGVINPTVSKSLSVWDKSTSFFLKKISGDVAHTGALDRLRRRRSRASIAWARSTIK